MTSSFDSFDGYCMIVKLKQSVVCIWMATQLYKANLATFYFKPRLFWSYFGVLQFSVRFASLSVIFLQFTPLPLFLITPGLLF